MNDTATHTQFIDVQRNFTNNVTFYEAHTYNIETATKPQQKTQHYGNSSNISNHHSINRTTNSKSVTPCTQEH